MKHDVDPAAHGRGLSCKTTVLCEKQEAWHVVVSLCKPMESAEILQSLHAAGFELQTFDRFPSAIGVSKGNCIALLEPNANGLRIIGRPGWRMGEALGVLTSKGERKVFQSKDQIVEATPERLKELEEFEAKLLKFLTLGLI